MKYCINCEHYRWDMVSGSKEFGWCNHSNNLKRNIVSGGLDIKYAFAYMNRDDPKNCGFSAKWFEPKVSKWNKIKNFFKRG